MHCTSVTKAYNRLYCIEDDFHGVKICDYCGLKINIKNKGGSHLFYDKTTEILPHGKFFYYYVVGTCNCTSVHV